MAMTMQQIPRMDLTPTRAEDSPTQSIRKSLALEAQKTLGYTKLAEAVAAPDELLKALQKLEITPFIPEAVEAYKKSKETRGMWSGHRTGLICLAAIPVALMVCDWLYRSLPEKDLTFFQGCGVALFVVLIVGSIGAIIMAGFHLLADNFKGSRTVREWELQWLGGYPGVVPEHVLAKAIEIKNLMPEIRFRIDQLVEQREDAPMRRMPDPFLVVERVENGNNERAPAGLSYYHGEPKVLESYYIDVWDEKEYERLM